MKKKLLTLLLALVAIATTGRAQVVLNSKKCPTCGKQVAEAQYAGHVASHKPTTRQCAQCRQTKTLNNFDSKSILCNICVHEKPRKKELVLNETLSNMVLIEGGLFMMGATNEVEESFTKYFPELSAKPQHQVYVESFYMSKFEVTQELWQIVMSENPSYWKGMRRPVEMVSWNECQTFISKLNALTGKNFRLPTEAEWEYAARGGQKGKGFVYSGSNNCDDVAWYTDNSDDCTHPVGQKLPNELGLYDMSGNIDEWCQDFVDNYSSDEQINPQGPSSGSEKVFRGGNGGGYKTTIRVWDRCSENPNTPMNGLGLRLALSK